ncbi:ATP-binding cassette transporter snq2 [Ophidiomyces ophidiicola]|nr:ATP-binding cassette transporter snq2 [Ophidiomyces ophidiicola]KAI1999920.1 ATP-binding cassette transporter snq2 [Ophidiomyces ophidiicola]KAI2016996.1 ATP-binding cassette transporter snq2 [Ophidiomyces ophidiicola]KAI2088049.1 ATP-binding cassette transporter snq2 [Ophidiomyces ophidiicola]KAI2098245.1 ATP-binding cassette transporter snq2 [Ophidiomyces ophidiicola]
MDAASEQPSTSHTGSQETRSEGDNHRDHSGQQESISHEKAFFPIRSASSRVRESSPSHRDAYVVLSRRETISGKSEHTNSEINQNGAALPGWTSANPIVSRQDEESAHLERILSTMFGRARQEASEEEKTRHVGVVWKNLTVKGVGLGATLQQTNSDVLLAIPRLLGRLFTGKIRKKKAVRTIIDDFTGCVKPGEMLLVLGQPGSGCSTFLKVVGNQRAGYESIDGEVSYGGTDAETMSKYYRSEVLYNPEDDLHYGTLSVRQTLKFAIRTRTPGKQSRKPGETRRQYRDTFVTNVAKLFWIEHCLDTKVGNSIVRGVSGGEKKRVSIAEALITKASTQCWDNSTRGLDASTALEYVQSLRSLTTMTHVSTLVAIYQASESLYNLFDKVILLIEGRCAYFGPIGQAKAYFEDLGFECPPRWTTADFLTSVAEPYARRVKKGSESRVPRSAEQFKAVYDRSAIKKTMLESIKDFEDELEVKRGELEDIRRTTPKKNFTIPYYQQVLALSARQFQVLIGDTQSLFGKWSIVLFLALIIGSLFYNLPKTRYVVFQYMDILQQASHAALYSLGVFTRGGCLFYIILFNALLSMAELTATFESRPILMKHKNFSFYRPSAYALAQVVVDIPQVFVQVSIFLLIVYFMADLARTASQFFIAFLFVWLITMTMYSFFRAIGALVASLDVGYLIPPGEMRPWLKWLVWINPVQYTFESLMANEFYQLKLQCVPPNLVPVGPNVSPQFQSCTVQGSRPGQTYVDGPSYILSNYDYTRDHLWRNFGIVLSLLVLFIVLTMIGTEIQTSARKAAFGGAAVTVFMKGQLPPSVKQEMENMNGNRDVEEGKPSTASTGWESDHIDDKETQGIAKNTSVFTWQNVNYTIRSKGAKKKLLQDVQGYIKPGRLCALVGASGAGKTTLLNVLAQRIDIGVVTGTFLIDGKPLPRSFQRATGFAEQADIHEPTSTVRESLRFSALLRRPKEIPIKEKYDYCERILELLELQSIAGATIGYMGAGLNQEQRKRVTIAVELASKPDLLLFLDEPTSGLDSLAAFNIVRFLRKLANAGQAILCTIHQPSAVLFEEFDDLLLLQAGGRVVFHGELGEDSRKLIEYFEHHGARPCPSDENPAEYMLDVIGAGNPEYKGPDWADIWANSPEHKATTEEIERLIKSRQDEKHTNMPDGKEFAASQRTQIIATAKRSFIAYWRTPQYTIGKFMLHIWTGLFNTFTFWHIRFATIDMQSRLFSIFLTLVIAPPLIQQLQPRYLHFRGLYEAREEKSKIYSWFPLITSAILPELPYSLVAGTICFCCWYFGIWFPRDSFTVWFCWMMFMLFELFYVGLGQAIAAVSPNALFASLLVPAFFSFVVSFCGVIVPYYSMPYFWRSWMYWLTPFRYLFEGYLGVVTNKIPVRCSSKEFARFSAPPGLTCEQYVGPFIQKSGGYVTTEPSGMCAFCAYANGNEFAASFHVFYQYKWRDFVVFISFIVFNFLAVYVLSWLYLRGVPAMRRRLNSYRTKQTA